MVHLSGITWNHTRGYLPVVATAQRFSELNPEVAIDWQVRSLQEFADFPLEELSKKYDLLVIDHPFCGYAAGYGTLLPLDDFLPEAFLRDQATNAVGLSHESYHFGGHQWALAIDAAAPVSGWRPDLMGHMKVALPRTWQELLDLAKRGLVVLPAVPVDSLMHFYMCCCALGEQPFQQPDQIVDEEVGIRALRMLRELLSFCDPDCFHRNPIATWQLLSTSDRVAYCPFAYGYSNYCRSGYSSHVLQVGGLVSVDGHHSCRSTLGGAGLAISSQCHYREVAVRYAEFVAAPQCQSTLYFDSGGQPGHRTAWLDTEVNRRSNNFFQNALPTLDSAYLRPRFDGYLPFQEKGGVIVHNYLQNGGPEKVVMQSLDQLLAGSHSGADVEIYK